MTLEAVEEFIVPIRLAEQTLEPIISAGKSGYEAFVLWGGQFTDDLTRFEFISAYVPEQQMSRSADGLLVVVDGEALFRVNRAFYERELTLGAQIHSHPTAAYHSETDDAFPLMTLTGGLSGVVPDFGDGGIDRLDDWAWYRLTGPDGWTGITDAGTRITFR